MKINQNSHLILEPSIEHSDGDLFQYCSRDELIAKLRSERKWSAGLEEALDGFLNEHFENDRNYNWKLRLVEIMRLSLMSWEEATGRDKFELAEDSGLWKVYIDRSTPQTRTLDKYLAVAAVPAKRPDWKRVLKTAYYVYSYTPEGSPHRKALEAAIRNFEEPSK